MTNDDLKTRPRFWFARNGDEIVAAGIMRSFDEPLIDLDQFGLLHQFDTGIIQIEVGMEVPHASRWTA